MITNENKKLAQWAMEFALKNGCQASRVSIYNGSSSSFEIRDMKMATGIGKQFGDPSVCGRTFRFLLYKPSG